MLFPLILPLLLLLPLALELNLLLELPLNLPPAPYRKLKADSIAMCLTGGGGINAGEQSSRGNRKEQVLSVIHPMCVKEELRHLQNMLVPPLAHPSRIFAPFPRVRL